MTQRVHVVLDETVLQSIDEIVGRRGRSRFLEEAARLRLRQLRQLEAIQATAGAWKDEDHPELAEGSAAYIANSRALSER